MPACCGMQSHRCSNHQLLAQRQTYHPHQSYQSTQNYVLNDNPTSSLLSLPTELLLRACSYLPVSSGCVLTLSCNDLTFRLSGEFWSRLNPDWPDKSDFLKLLQRDLPDARFCSIHRILHATSGEPDSGQGGYTFDGFYRISLAQIEAINRGGLCEQVFSCRTILYPYLGKLKQTVRVSYRLRGTVSSSIGPYIQRDYRVPISSHRSFLSTTDDLDLGLNIQLCSHITLKEVVRPSGYTFHLRHLWNGPVQSCGGERLNQYEDRRNVRFECRKCLAFGMVTDPAAYGHQARCAFASPLQYFEPEKFTLDPRWPALRG
ncbi:hypothetical protein BT63DRAFT_454144 [Microthyrium microscopicum]|uniref:Uncharacterized protein n=1 Tax=Microthyrium microscopicum TaxID=703497 RepID=A0A6A6UGE5_9PEZI|nr:hypothetical protein BT63DRAFT_454144 [Microthyrium microscopicum]